MAKVISFINYKGGVGKTTSTYHIGCALAGLHNKRVLMIDIDPQTNLTFLCAPVEKWKKFKSSQGTIADMYKRYQEKKAPDTKRCTWQNPVQVLGGRGRIGGLDLVPCDIDLIGEDLGGGAVVSGVFPTVESLRRNASFGRLFSGGAIRAQRTRRRLPCLSARGPSTRLSFPFAGTGCCTLTHCTQLLCGISSFHRIEGIQPFDLLPYAGRRLSRGPSLGNL